MKRDILAIEIYMLLKVISHTFNHIALHTFLSELLVNSLLISHHHVEIFFFSLPKNCPGQLSMGSEIFFLDPHPTGPMYGLLVNLRSVQGLC